VARKRKNQTGADKAEPTAPVVGVGASGANTEGLAQFLASADVLGEAAIVIVLQRREALTDEALKRLKQSSVRPIAPVADGARPEPGGIYLAAEAMKLTISDGVLRLRPAKEPAGERGTIDSFLVSLAEDARERSVGVVLSGVGGDGTLGVTAIREGGGFSLAEKSADEADAEHALQSAPALADAVAPASELAGRIAAHLANARRQANARGFEEMVADAGPLLTRIATVLRNRTGHDFPGSQHNTFTRRVQRRMQVTQTPGIEAYLDYLRADPEEAQELFNDLIIGVTHFFRDGKEFEALEHEVIPKLFEGKQAGDHLRVWVLGCATGEEAYSIAILLRERMAKLDAVPHIQIFATDIDSRALAQARVGRYAASAVQEVSPDRLTRWFVKEGDTYCVVKELREMCIFSQHNLIKDAPFSRLDLISCRNLLIYLNADLQNRVIPLFHFALRPGGFLFLGNSENVSRHTKLFTPVDRRYRIFKQVQSSSRVLPDFPLTANADRRGNLEPAAVPRASFNTGAAVTKQAERIMERYAPAYLILDENHDVLHFSGRTGRFLDPPTGLASLNVYNLIHRDLRMDLRSALHQAETEQASVRVAGLRVGQNGKTIHVTLSVEPIDGGAGQPTHFAVILQDGHVAADEEGEAAARNDGTQQSDEHVHRLEEELRVTRDRLQATIEELESTNEELKASNEEYQSVNEELQSSNEELETSKEELQSLNEELQTVNGELAHRVEELGRANSDLKNLLESTQIATVFLDNDLRITSFTPAMTEIVHLIESDIGRPLHHISRKIAYEDLEQDVRRVIRTLGTIERETLSPATNSRYLTRILPYRSINNVIEGAVVTFLDVTQLSRAEERLRDSEARLRAIVEGIPQLVWRATEGGHWTWSSPQWTEFTGQSEADSLKLGWLDMVDPEDRPKVRKAWEDAAVTGTLSVEHKLWNAREAGYRAVHLRASPVARDGNRPIEWAGTATDIHELLRLQEGQQLLLHELQHRVRNVLSVVRSVALRTSQSSDSVQAYAETLEGRINALARTQNVLTSAPGATIDLATVLREELKAQGGEIGRQLTVEGPPILLSGKAAETFTLLLELATNAAKYGALSEPGGHIEIEWTVEPRGKGGRAHLVFRWIERGIEVQPPTRRGFGSELIENVVSYQFGGTGQLEYGSDGMRCVLELPISDELRPAESSKQEKRHV
jgi:two-component system CheB/CheR fusion protein